MQAGEREGLYAADSERVWEGLGGFVCGWGVWVMRAR